MTASKKQYEDLMRASEHDVAEMKQQIAKYRSQKRVLVAEIRNLQAQSESQVAVAMAEANEARMVNKRLKKQNELLLTQIRSLVDDAREQEKKLQDEVEQKMQAAQMALQQLHVDEIGGDDGKVAAAPLELPTLSPESHVEVEEETPQEPDPASTVPYTLSASDIALLNGQRAATPPRPLVRPTSDGRTSSTPLATQSSGRSVDAHGISSGDTHRDRLVAFFTEKDPSMLPEVDAMLASYAGFESMLFESLELKYNFVAFAGNEE
jgi:hypothetical protein